MYIEEILAHHYEGYVESPAGSPERATYGRFLYNNLMDLATVVLGRMYGSLEPSIIQEIANETAGDTLMHLIMHPPEKVASWYWYMHKIVKAKAGRWMAAHNYHVVFSNSDEINDETSVEFLPQQTDAYAMILLQQTIGLSADRIQKYLATFRRHLGRQYFAFRFVVLESVVNVSPMIEKFPLPLARTTRMAIHDVRGQIDVIERNIRS